jgi:hypothetical protein
MRSEKTSSCTIIKRGLTVLGLVLLTFSISGAALFAQDVAKEDEEDDEPFISSPAPTDVNRTYALVELGTILGGGLVWYNMDHSNEKDQLYDTQGAFANRFNGFSAWNFDSNLFETNYISHPGAGMLYYLTGRANGYSKFQSYFFAIGGSACWEYFCEIQEVVSINDMIVTPFGGAAIGEPVYQLISHIGKDNPCSISSLNRMSPYASRFPLGLGYGYNGKQYMTLATDYESINCDVVSPARSYSGFINDTMATRIRLNLAISDNHLEYAYFHTQSMLAGFVSIRNRYTANYSAGLVSGLNTAFTYEMHHYGTFMDKVGSAHLLGLSYATYMRKGDFYFLADGVAYFDFGSINSYGLSPYLKSGHTMSDVAANGAFVTSINDYYFALGNSVMVRLSAGYGRTSAAFEMNYLSYGSIDTDGRTDRVRATGKNFVMSDSRLMIKGTLTRQLIDEIAISTSYAYRRIWGSAAGISRLGHESSVEMSLAYTGI